MNDVYLFEPRTQMILTFDIDSIPPGSVAYEKFSLSADQRKDISELSLNEVKMMLLTW